MILTVRTLCLLLSGQLLKTWSDEINGELVLLVGTENKTIPGIEPKPVVVFTIFYSTYFLFFLSHLC